MTESLYPHEWLLQQSGVIIGTAIFMVLVWIAAWMVSILWSVYDSAGSTHISGVGIVLAAVVLMLMPAIANYVIVDAR